MVTWYTDGHAGLNDCDKRVGREGVHVGDIEEACFPAGKHHMYGLHWRSRYIKPIGPVLAKLVHTHVLVGPHTPKWQYLWLWDSHGLAAVVHGCCY